MSIKIQKNRWTLIKSGVTNSNFSFQKNKNGGSHLYSLWWGSVPDTNPLTQINPDDGLLVSVGAGGGAQPFSEKINLTFSAAKDVYAWSYYADGKVTEANEGPSIISDLTITSVINKSINIEELTDITLAVNIKGGIAPFTYTLTGTQSDGTTPLAGAITQGATTDNFVTYTGDLTDDGGCYWWEVTDSATVPYTYKSEVYPITISEAV